MNDSPTILELKSQEKNSSFESIFILKEKTSGVTKQSSPMFSITLSDASGSFKTKIWENTHAFNLIESVKLGSILKIIGKTSSYQGNFQAIIENIEILKIENISKEILKKLYEVPPESENHLWKVLEQSINNIQHKQLKETVEYAIKLNEKNFRLASAAIMMHHAYRHGLLEHTAHMLQIAESLLPIYKEVDSDLAIAGIILHDIGKLKEYDEDKELSTIQKSRAGILHGHVILGYKITREAALKSNLNEDLTERLEHIILSHQGELEYGAAVKAATPEAVFVSMIDNLDAQMGMVQRTLRNNSIENNFSERLKGLGASLLLTPPKKD